MRILIDGYNLLHTIGFHGNLSEPGVLETARLRTLDKLQHYLTEEERKNTLVIFDAGHRSKQQPQQYVRHSIRVEFAMDYPDADTMIQELIRNDNVPKHLLVISSDHRIQRTAQARRARFMDSDQWVVLLESRLESDDVKPVPEKPVKPDPENEYWVEKFSTEPLEEMLADSDPDVPDDQLNEPFVEGDYDIFPPGYGEDLV